MSRTARPDKHAQDMYAKLCKLEGLWYNRRIKLLGKKWDDRVWQEFCELLLELVDQHHQVYLALAHHPTALRQYPPKLMYGIWSTLEHLQDRLPTSWHLIKDMVPKLYKIIEGFRDLPWTEEVIWIECLAALLKYNLDTHKIWIEEMDGDVPRGIEKDLAKFASSSRRLYNEVLDRLPATGRIYNRLAKLSEHDPEQAMLYLMKALCVLIPFEEARKDLEMETETFLLHSPDTVSQALLRVHCMLFRDDVDALDGSIAGFIEQLRSVNIMSTDLARQMGIITTCAMLQYGSPTSGVVDAFKDRQDQRDQPDQQDRPDHNRITVNTWKGFNKMLGLANRTHQVMLERFDDASLPYWTIMLAFIYRLTFYPRALDMLSKAVPWQQLPVWLNKTIKSAESRNKPKIHGFPLTTRPLPEDYDVRGALWADTEDGDGLFPHNWFSVDVKFDDRYAESDDMSAARRVRVRWLAGEIAAHSPKLVYDQERQEFFIRRG